MSTTQDKIETIMAQKGAAWILEARARSKGSTDDLQVAMVRELASSEDEAGDLLEYKYFNSLFSWSSRSWNFQCCISNIPFNTYSSKCNTLFFPACNI